MQVIDTLLFPRWLLRVSPDCIALANHAVALDNEQIVAVGPAVELTRQFDARQTVSLDDHVLMPGLVNLHTHAAMSLMRGFADDQPLMTWLNDHIWPAEAKCVNDEYVFDGTLLAAAEMIRCGTTCANDMYFFPHAQARSALQAGIRATIGMPVFEFPTAYGTGPDDYIHKGLTARDAFRGEALLNWSLAPHAPYTVADSTFRKVDTLAEELDIQIHLHVHETQAEIEGSLKEYGKRPLQRLRELNVVSQRLISVHSVHLTDSEIELLALSGAHVAHCPASNLKLASGISPTAALRKAGVNVGIGTDGTASNNTLDMFAEMRLAALLAKGASGDATSWTAAQTLRAVTLDAAKALALDSKIGSIEVGKQADLIAVNLSNIETQPVFDVAAHLVYSAGREHVTHSWVAGRCLMDNRVLTPIEEPAVLAKARWWQAQLQNKVQSKA
jgi:5-methylthioadenosine/S-adenosylhomocysteine deaminase